MRLMMRKRRAGIYMMVGVRSSRRTPDLIRARYKVFHFNLHLCQPVYAFKRKFNLLGCVVVGRLMYVVSAASGACMDGRASGV